MFDLWFTFVPALIPLGRLCDPLLMLSKVFNASLSAYVCHLVDAAECSFSIAQGHPGPGERQMRNEPKFLSLHWSQNRTFKSPALLVKGFLKISSSLPWPQNQGLDTVGRALNKEQGNLVGSKFCHLSQYQYTLSFILDPSFRFS